MFRVSPSVVSQYVTKFKNAGHMQRLLQKDEHAVVKVQVVKTMVECMLLEGQIIDSAESVCNRIDDELEIDMTPQFVRTVMTKEMGMSYRKILKASYHSNSPQNRILRQQWALKFIELWEAGYTFLNIDETWLGMSDMRKMKWREHGTSNAVATVLMCPRISMITGVDTLGNSYVTLTQANSNSSIMQIYFMALVKKLDKIRPNWREKTVVLLDGASYHNSKPTIQIFEQFKIPVMFLAPHSYNVAPCELYFAWFKKADINPRKLKQSKR